MKTYTTNGYSFEITQKSEDCFDYTVCSPDGKMCDSGSSKTKNGAERKARRAIKLFSSY